MACIAGRGRRTLEISAGNPPLLNTKAPIHTGHHERKNQMLTYTNTLDIITTAAHGEINPRVLEAAATEIWERNDFETQVDFDAYPHTWDIIARHDA